MSKAEQAELVIADRHDIAAPDGSPLALVMQAAATGATPEQIGQWMDLQERWGANEARKAYFTAMGRFQGECPAIPRTKTVQGRTGGLLYKYAPLEKILDVIRATEAACGFMHTWDQDDLENGGVRVTCRISHIAGHSETSTVTIPATTGMNTSKAQDKGIISSYGKRYSLLNAYGLATGGEDADGAAPSEPVQTITASQIATLKKALEDKGRDLKGACTYAKVDKPEQITVDKYEELLDMMAKAGKKGAATA